VDEKRAMAGFDPLPKRWSLQQSDEENKTGILELKFNPWHDAQNGQFTHEGQGNRFVGGGGSFGGGGASGSWGKPKPKPKSGNGGFGGGQSGGGGASGSWDKSEPKKPPAQPKREIVKPKLPTGKIAKPEATPKVRTVKSGGYNFDVDNSNRTVRAYGQLRLQPDQPRSRRQQRDAGKPDREPKDHGGHFIGRQFGGPEISYNHFAQNARFNTSEYRKLENEWKGYLKAGKKVKVDVRAIYRGNSKRPHKLRIIYQVDGKFEDVTIPNRK
jgi:DNA/RNA non-specific endonuclease